jgi:hypothetical protein
MSDLLKESIADAKAVRETAIANAKIFLEENFAKSMKEMFADKLKEESEESDEEDKMEETLATSKINATHNTKPAGKQQFDANMDEGTEITSEELDEILAELETDGEMMNNEMMHNRNDDDTDPMSFANDDSDGGMGDPKSPADSDGFGDFTLDELLAELDEVGEEAPVAPAPLDPTIAAQLPVAPAPVAPVAPVAPAPVAPVVGQIPSPSEGDDYDISTEEMVEALVALNEENEALKAHVQEAMNTVKYMKDVLAETNLLNAKLLYTNKLFKGKNLTETQKHKVISTFDLTRTLREIKLAYTVLAESFNAGVSVAKKKTNATVSTITEGLASKRVSSTKPESTIVEPYADVMASRFQKLAGITK